MWGAGKRGASMDTCRVESCVISTYAMFSFCDVQLMGFIDIVMNCRSEAPAALRLRLAHESAGALGLMGLNLAKQGAEVRE